MNFTSYALCGSGRVAQHFTHYLNQLGLPFSNWSRATGEDFEQALTKCSHVLLAVSDQAIAELAARTPNHKIVVHFSGFQQVKGTFAAHPLMTFGAEPLDQDFYKSIPFVVDKGVEFAQILPGLPNEAFELDPALRTRYHALCALAGNSAFLLWRKISAEFRSLGLPPGILESYLQQTVTNALGTARATGPVARSDWSAVIKHLDSLRDKPALFAAYRDFLNQAAFDGQKIPEALL